MRKRELIAEYRAAKKAADEQNYTEGVAEGRDWAASDPVPYVELNNLAGDRGTLKHFGYDDLDFVTGLILGCEEPDCYSVKDFWESAVGEDWPRSVLNPEFLRGFCEGALEVWAEVEPHLV